jgi:hypothetical protein
MRKLVQSYCISVISLTSFSVDKPFELVKKWFCCLYQYFQKFAIYTKNKCFKNQYSSNR